MVRENITSIRYKNNLELKLIRDANNKTIYQHQYTTYPLRLSSIFRLEGIKTNRAYAYIINTSPGLLANDALSLSLHLTENTSLYLTDQAATKVHPMPQEQAKATIKQQIIVENNASLELMPEPLILYQDSILEQYIDIQLYPQAQLFLTEIILPGRLAKEEYYDFNYYFNRLKVRDSNNKLLYVDAIRLLGKDNPFKGNKLYVSLPIIGSAIAILPGINLNDLINQLEEYPLVKHDGLEASITVLPAENGIAIRALANKTSKIKQYFTFVLGCIRHITQQANLPYIPK